MGRIALIYGGAACIGLAVGLWQAVFVCVGTVAILHGICLCMDMDS